MGPQHEEEEEEAGQKRHLIEPERKKREREVSFSPTTLPVPPCDVVLHLFSEKTHFSFSAVSALWGIGCTYFLLPAFSRKGEKGKMLPISPSDLQKKGRGSVCGEMGYIPLSLPGKSPRLRYLFPPLVIYGAESWFRTRKEEEEERGTAASSIPEPRTQKNL